MKHDKTAPRTKAHRLGAFAVLTSVVAANSAFGVSVPVAVAHDSVIKSVPANGATIAEFPHSIELTFSGEPRPNFNTVAISDVTSGEVLFTAEPELDGQLVSVEVPQDINPGAGEYIVGFQITSSDGHSTRGKVGFTVGEGAAGAGEDGTQTDQPLANQDDGAGVPTWAIVGAGVIIVAVIGVIGGVAIRNHRTN